jgi:acetolactate synthase-1/2/3 large subunit
MPLLRTGALPGRAAAGEAASAHQAIDVVRAVLPRDGILAFDVGAHTHQIASQWTAHAPRSFLITNVWSSMGFGLPAGIAAKLARPEQPAVAVIGDGCFQMTCGEVAVARRMGITLPVVVLDDKWLALIRVKQIRRQLPIYGTALQSEDYGEPPLHYFGAPAIGVRSPQALEVAVTQALAADGRSNRGRIDPDTSKRCMIEARCFTHEATAAGLNGHPRLG